GAGSGSDSGGGGAGSGSSGSSGAGGESRRGAGGDEGNGGAGGGGAGRGAIVRLRDVAVVRRDVSPQFILVTADGHDAVQLDVFQQPGGNTVDIARSIRDVLAAEQSRLPGVTLTCWYDQSDLI